MLANKFFLTEKTKQYVNNVDQEIINMAHDRLDPKYGSYYASERTNEQYNDEFIRNIDYLNSFE